MWPLARVRPHVVVMVLLLGECLPTELATEGFLAGVGPQVGNEVSLARQSLTAEVALERLLAGVHPLMADDLRRAVIGVGAVTALMLALPAPVRRPLVAVEETPRGERECAVPAVEGPAYHSDGHDFLLCWGWMHRNLGVC